MLIYDMLCYVCNITMTHRAGCAVLVFTDQAMLIEAIPRVHEGTGSYDYYRLCHAHHTVSLLYLPSYAHTRSYKLCSMGSYSRLCPHKGHIAHRAGYAITGDHQHMLIRLLHTKLGYVQYAQYSLP